MNYEKMGSEYCSNCNAVSQHENKKFSKFSLDHSLQNKTLYNKTIVPADPISANQDSFMNNTQKPVTQIRIELKKDEVKKR